MDNNSESLTNNCEAWEHFAERPNDAALGRPVRLGLQVIDVLGGNKFA